MIFLKNNALPMWQCAIAFCPLGISIYYITKACIVKRKMHTKQQIFSMLFCRFFRCCFNIKNITFATKSEHSYYIFNKSASLFLPWQNEKRCLRMSKTAGFGVSEFFFQRPCGCEKEAGSAACHSGAFGHFGRSKWQAKPCTI